MLRYFKSKPPNLLGIDIASTSVKLLELACIDNKYSVESYALVPFSSEILDKATHDRTSLSDAIKRAVSQANVTSHHVAAAVPPSSVISKIIQIDAGLSDEDLEAQVAYEAEKYIPYPLAEVSLDFNVISPSTSNHKQIEVLLVASRTDNVENRVDNFVEAGLIVEAVDVESYAIERVCRLMADQFPNQGREQTVAIIDIGATVTNLTFLHNLSVVFTREEVFGGLQLTKAIQHRYGLSYSEAELAKQAGNLPADYEAELLLPFKESAVLQVRRALQFFFSASHQHDKVNTILLAGGVASVPGLASLIEEQVGISTAIANPFQAMSIANKVNAEMLMKDAPALLISCGLALRSFE